METYNNVTTYLTGEVRERMLQFLQWATGLENRESAEVKKMRELAEKTTDEGLRKTLHQSINEKQTSKLDVNDVVAELSKDEYQEIVKIGLNVKAYRVSYTAKQSSKKASE